MSQAKSASIWSGYSYSGLLMHECAHIHAQRRTHAHSGGNENERERRSRINGKTKSFNFIFFQSAASYFPDISDTKRRGVKYIVENVEV